MTLNWATQVSFDPKLLAIAVEVTALTHELISAGRVFALCIIDREDRAIVRKFTKPVEVDAGAQTLNGFPYRDGVTGAPILTQAVAYVDCEVRQTRWTAAATRSSSARSSTPGSDGPRTLRCCAWRTPG